MALNLHVESDVSGEKCPTPPRVVRTGLPGLRHPQDVPAAGRLPGHPVQNLNVVCFAVAGYVKGQLGVDELAGGHVFVLTLRAREEAATAATKHRWADAKLPREVYAVLPDAARLPVGRVVSLADAPSLDATASVGYGHAGEVERDLAVRSRRAQLQARADIREGAVEEDARAHDGSFASIAFIYS